MKNSLAFSTCCGSQSRFETTSRQVMNMKSLFAPLAQTLLASGATAGNGLSLTLVLPTVVATLALFCIGQLIAIAYLVMRVTAIQHQLRMHEDRLANFSQNSVTRQYLESSLMANVIQRQVEKSIGLLRAELGLKIGPFGSRLGSDQHNEPSMPSTGFSGPGTLQVRDLTPTMTALRALIVTRRSRIPDDDDSLAVAMSDLRLPDSGPPLSIPEFDQLAAILNRELLQKSESTGIPVNPVTVRHRRSQTGEPNLVLCIPRTVLNAF